MTILSVVEGILTNIFSSQLYDEKNTLLEKLRLWFFRKKLLKWIRKYIIGHDGTILTTDDFEAFLTNYHLIEKIFDQVSAGNTNVSKETFINNQIETFHMMQKNPYNNKFSTDYELKKFIEHFYDKIDLFFLRYLSQNDKYLASRIDVSRQNTIEAIDVHSSKLSNEISEIKDILQNKNELSDSEDIWSIYQLLSKSIKDGKVDEVAQIFPLIIGKSKDLEESTAYLLGLFSDNPSFRKDFDQIQKDIIDDRIYMDICRISIYVNSWRKNTEELRKITAREPTLSRIVKLIIEEDSREFYSIEKKEQDGITYFNYQIQNNYPKELWIIKRVCLLDIFEQPVFNASESFKIIVGEPENILDRLLLLERELTEVVSKPILSAEETKKLLDKAICLKNISSGLALDFRSKIYEILIRISLMSSKDDINNIVESIPDDLHDIKEIELLLLEAKSRDASIESDVYIRTCTKHNEYWPFNNFLIRILDRSPAEAKELIEKYLFVIDKDPSIFLIYVQLVNKLDSTEKALELFSTYKNVYGDYAEFWIEKLRIQYDDNELESLISHNKSGKQKYLSNCGSSALIELLVQHNKDAEALDIIKALETTGNISPNIQKSKALALLRTGREIEALSVFTDIFISGNHSEEIIFYILALSYNNSRSVVDDVLDVARQSENPQILVLVAGYLFLSKSLPEAHTLNLKAMLRSTDTSKDAFTQRLALVTAVDHAEEIKINSVDLNTVVFLKSTEDETSLAYAIHSERVLPAEHCLWEGAYHIYKETAINLGLFRKGTGETLFLSGKEFTIISIETLDAYLFRISMEKSVANGTAKKLIIPMTDKGTVDRDRFVEVFKEALGDPDGNMKWLDLYRDLSQIPITFFFSKRFISGTYFNLVNTIIESKEVIYREIASDVVSNEKGFIFSFAALIVLFKIGWKPEKRSSMYAIPCCLNTIVDDETETTIRNNNRDLVSFMGVKDNKFFIVESSEEDKIRYMQDAVSFKEYCDYFRGIENTTDLIMPSNNEFNAKEVLGIADYDSIAIAKNESRVLVSAEIMVTGVANLPEVQANTVCIIDFLTETVQSPDELLRYIHRLVEYRFAIPFTSKAVQKIINYFYEVDEETQKSICDQWEAILNIPMIDENYKSVMLSVMRDCIMNLQNDSDVFCPVRKLLLAYALKYTKKRIICSTAEDGRIAISVVNDEE